MSTLLGVVSDSHGNHDFLSYAVRMLQGLGAEVLLHLGDNALDVESGIPLPVYSVPGKFEPAYADVSKRTLALEFAGWKVAMSHVFAELPEGDIRLYGHTHVPAAESMGEVLRLCPGHLKSQQDKGEQPSFALLELDNLTAAARIFRLGCPEPFVRLILTKGPPC